MHFNQKAFYMKRLSAGILLFAVIAMFSCTKTVEAPKQAYTVDVNVNSNQWQSSGGSYTVTIPVQYITNDVIDYGAVSAFLSTDNVTVDPMPVVYGKNTYTYYYENGYITLYCYNALGGSVSVPPSALWLKVLIIYP